MNFGIICELNPLHKGHKHLFDYCKKNGDGLILAMSGNFTQRGDFAVYDKYERAKTAVENGADLVIEIPTICALQSAQGYAKAGVKILEATGICDTLAFGAENADIGELKKVAKEITDRDGEITEALKSGLLIRDCSNYEGLTEGHYRIALRSEEENERLITWLEKL